MPNPHDIPPTGPLNSFQKEVVAILLGCIAGAFLSLLSALLSTFPAAASPDTPARTANSASVIDADMRQRIVK